MGFGRKINSINDVWAALEARQLDIDTFAEISLFIEDNPDLLILPKRDFPIEPKKPMDEWEAMQAEVNAALGEEVDNKIPSHDSSKTLLHLLAEISPDSSDLEAVEDYKIFVEDMLRQANFIALDDKGRDPLSIAKNLAQENTAFIEVMNTFLRKRKNEGNPIKTVSNAIVKEKESLEEIKERFSDESKYLIDLGRKKGNPSVDEFKQDTEVLLKIEKNDLEAAQMLARHFSTYGQKLVNEKGIKSADAREKAAACFKKLLKLENNDPSINEMKKEACKFLDKHYKFCKEQGLTDFRNQVEEDLGVSKKATFSEKKSQLFEKVHTIFHKQKKPAEKLGGDEPKVKGPGNKQL